MIEIALIEDQEDCASHFKYLVDEYRKKTGKEVNLRRFKDGFSFLDTYENNRRPNYTVVFMDIEMPLISGLETARKMRKVDEQVPLIFVTVMAELAIKGYEVNAMDFIIKPLTYFNFALKLDKAIRLKERMQSIVLKLNNDEGLAAYVDSKEISYIESFNHLCVFHTTKGKFSRYASMAEMEEKLAGDNFIRCNNSYIINAAFVSRITGNSIIMADGNSFQISRGRKKRVIDKFTAYFKYLY